MSASKSTKSAVSPTRRLFRGLVAAAAAVALTTVARGAALTDAAPRSFNIQPQPLSSALNEFAIQSHEQIVFSTDITHGKTSQGVSGTLAPASALRRLLARTGLVASRSNGMILVSQAADKSRIHMAQTNTVVRKEKQTPIQLQTVMVTADKEIAPIESVPMSVSVFNLARLARRGAHGLSAIAALTPGFVYQDYSVAFDASPTIRGLSQFNITSSVANVSTEVNGVYIPRNYSIDLGIADVSSVQITKGPQSALYGSNAFAGMISYTLTPPPNHRQASVTLTAGNAGRFDYKLAAGDSWLDNRVAVRGYYARTEFNGTWKNLFPGDPSLGGYHNDTFGGTARIKPTTSLTIDLAGFRLNRAEAIRPAYNLSSNDPQQVFNCSPFICGALNWNLNAYQSAASTHLPGLVQPPQPGFHSGTTFYNARVAYDINPQLHFVYNFGVVDAYATEITSSSDNPLNPPIGINFNIFAVSGCLVGAPTCNFDFGRWNSDVKEGGTNKLVSHEVRFDWRRGNWRALLGGYLAHDTDDYAFQLGSTAPGAPVVGNGTSPFDFTNFDFPLLGQGRTTKSTAVFGLVSYHFFDRRAGVSAQFRHETDKLGSIASTTGVLLNAPAADIQSRSSTFSFTTPRVTLTWNFTPSQLVYASAAKGVKQGGFNPLTSGGRLLPADEQSFSPETNWTYELGTKNTLLARRLILNADVFYVSWQNLQIPEPPGLSSSAGALQPTITVNQGGATSKGLESEGSFAATRNLDFNYSFSYVDATFNTGTFDGGILGICQGLACSPSIAALSANPQIGGKQLPRYSKVQAVGGITWRQAIGARLGFLGDDLIWTAHAEVTYQSQQQADETNITQIPARALVNLSTGLRGDRWDLTLWGRNVTNVHYVADSFYVAGAYDHLVSYGVSLGELATYGVTFNYHFF